MTSDSVETRFAAKAIKLGRFLPDGKQEEFFLLMKDAGHTVATLVAEQRRLTERLHEKADESGRLRRRLQRLARQCEKIQGIFTVNDRVFHTFRTALALSRNLRSLSELPAALKQLAKVLDVGVLTCLLCREDFDGLAPVPLPRRSRQHLQAALAALPHTMPNHPIFMDTVAHLPEPAFFLDDGGNRPTDTLAGGSCCIAPLLDKYAPGRLIGALVLADPDPTRYAPEKGSDFLEHFSEVFAGDLQHVRMHEKLLHESESDELTGIPNRAFLAHHGPPLLALSERKSAPIVMLFCDLDRFKAVNDTCGHAVGDGVLRAVAQSIAAQVRPYDLLARLGGDEFVLLLPDTTPAQARILAERLHHEVAEAAAAAVNNRDLCVSVSIGLVQHVPGQDIDALIRRADAAMYTIKRS